MINATIPAPLELVGIEYFALVILQTYSEIDREVALVALPESSKDFGNVYLDHEMRIVRFVEKPDANQANYVFAGMFVLFPEIFILLEKYGNDILVNEESIHDHLYYNNSLYGEIYEINDQEIKILVKNI